MNLGRSSGGLPPDAVVEDAGSILSECQAAVAAYHDPSFDSLLQVALAPCSPFSVTGELMRDCAELARALLPTGRAPASSRRALAYAESVERARSTEELYRERILKHAKTPRNWSPPAPPLERVDLQFRDLNPVCGDDLTVKLALERDGEICDVRFEGHVCAICQAAASMASDEIRHRRASEILALDRSFILQLLGTEIPPLRLRCALLPLKVLKSAALGRPADWEPGTAAGADRRNL